MNTSRVIVSINKDVNAPIFKHSTYGIVADMFDVVPALTKALTGGEIPVVDISKPAPIPKAPKTEVKQEPKAVAAPKSEEATAKPAKKLSLKERLAAKKAKASSAPTTSSTTKNPFESIFQCQTTRQLSTEKTTVTTVEYCLCCFG